MTTVQHLMNDRPEEDLDGVSRREAVISKLAVLPPATAKANNVRGQAEAGPHERRGRRPHRDPLEVLPRHSRILLYKGNELFLSQVLVGPQGIRPWAIWLPWASTTSA